MNKFVSINCERCICGANMPGFTKTKTGCNFCDEYKDRLAIAQDKSGELDTFLNNLKSKRTLGSKYDCIVGVSGGVDSSYVLLLAKKYGLNALAVQMDNGWNSREAQLNISNLIDASGFDYVTHVINWETYSKLQRAFFSADVIDIELLYDNALLGTLYNAARKYGVKYILAGTNTATEGMRLPNGWNWYKYDVTNIKSIAKSQNVRNFGNFPFIDTIKKIYLEKRYGITWVSFLDYVNYNKAFALEQLQNFSDYRSYDEKHGESIFTRFYQGYILPKKFNIDKRQTHISTLVASNQITKEHGVKMINNMNYFEEKYIDDFHYCCEKLNFSYAELNAYLKRPAKLHSYYRSEYVRFKKLQAFLKK